MTRQALARLEIRNDRAHAAVVVVGLRHSQLHQDAAHVLLDRSFGYPELAADAGIGAAFGHEGEHLTLARGEDVQRIVAAAGGDELLDEGGVDDGTAARDPAERVDELVDVGNPALGQVAAALAAGESVHSRVYIGLD